MENDQNKGETERVIPKAFPKAFPMARVSLSVRFTDEAFVGEAARLGITEEALRAALARLILPSNHFRD